jgi:hypothetical protein
VSLPHASHAATTCLSCSYPDVSKFKAPPFVMAFPISDNQYLEVNVNLNMGPINQSKSELLVYSILFYFILFYFIYFILFNGAVSSSDYTAER